MAQAVVLIHGVLSTARDREPQSVTRKQQWQGHTYLEAPNQRVSAANGIDYAYRAVGDGPVPLVLLHHFRGNLDYWDPALIDALTSSRRAHHVRQCRSRRFDGNDPEHDRADGG
jgi:hypothetical protein